MERERERDGGRGKARHNETMNHRGEKRSNNKGQKICHRRHYDYCHTT